MVGVAAADLHDLVVTFGINERGDLSRHRPGEIRVETRRRISFCRQHFSLSACQLCGLGDGDAAVGQDNFSSPYGGHEFNGYLGLVAGGVFAQGVVALDGDYAHGDAGVGADDASVVVQGAISNSVRSSFKSFDLGGLEFLQFLLVVLTDIFQARRVACASDSSILDMANPTWIRTQSPTSTPRRSGRGR